jgi:hypothetical protein
MGQTRRVSLFAIDVVRLVSAGLASVSSGETENTALLLPGERQAGMGQQLLRGKVARMATLLRSPNDANDRDVLDQDQIGWNRLDATARKSDDQHPRFPIDRAQCLVERIPADRIVDDVSALAIRQRSHPIADTFLSVG